MNLIPESNGLSRLKMRQKISRVKLGKKIIVTIVLIILIGYIFQTISNFIGKEKIESILNYVKVDNSRIEYQVKGTGDYTIVFDGAIGTNLYQWDGVIEELDENIKVRTFVYNRNGYGFSDSGDYKTPKKQAEDLKILLRKSGVSGKVILVGEEYGSLIATNFVNLYPESVAGMIMIKPLDEEKVKSDTYKENLKMKYYKSIIETIGSYFGLTTILDKYDLTYEVYSFEESLTEVKKEEYDIHKTKKNFRQAIQNEFTALYSYSDGSQIPGIMKNKPLYIISNYENDSMSKLGDRDKTTIYKTESTKDLISTTDIEAVTNAITSVVREAKRLENTKTN